MLLHLDLNFLPRSEQIRSCFHIWQKYYSPVNKGGVAPASLSAKKIFIFSRCQRGVHRGLPILTLVSTSGSSSFCNPTFFPSLLGSELQTQKTELKIPEKQWDLKDHMILWSSHDHQYLFLFMLFVGNIYYFFSTSPLKHNSRIMCSRARVWFQEWPQDSHFLLPKAQFTFVGNLLSGRHVFLKCSTAAWKLSSRENTGAGKG